MLMVGKSATSKFSHFKTSSNKRYKSLQGTFIPRPGGKYIGAIKNPKFKSKIELRLMTMLDNPNAINVVSWTYESKKIPYVDKSSPVMNPNGMVSYPTRHYIIDFIVTVRNKNGGTDTFWIETKSINDLVVNKKPIKKKTKSAQISEKIKVKNFCKWIAASKAAKSVNAHFIVVTESELDKLKSIIF